MGGIKIFIHSEMNDNNIAKIYELMDVDDQATSLQLNDIIGNLIMIWFDYPKTIA